MKMKTISRLFLITVLSLIIGMGAMAQEEENSSEEKQKKTLEIDYSVALNFSYNSAQVKIGNNDLENTLVYSYLALEVDLDLMDYLTVGVLAGYNMNHLDDPVDFINLPLSLRLGDENFKSMVLGVRARSEFFSWKDFSFVATGEFLVFKRFEKELPINLPIASGIATVKNSFTQTAVELLVKYEGLETLTIFAGPQLNLINGEVEASHSIEELSGQETLEFKQKQSLGVTAGVHFELGNHFEVDVKAYLLSKTSLSLELFYIF